MKFVSKLLAFLTAIVIAVFSISLTVSAAKIDMDYEGEVDPYTGMPANSEETTETYSITVNSGVVYNKLSNKFAYSITGTDMVIDSSVLSGTVTTGSVSLTVPSGVSAVLYKNGAVVTDPSYDRITDIGAYVLAILDTDTKYQLIRFTIVPEKTGMLSLFQAPSDCVILGVTFNDTKQRLTDRRSLSMEEDGEYAISYRCDAVGIDYMLRLTIDHTPSPVVFNGVSDGVARGPVVLEGLEKGDKVKIWLDSQEITLPSEDNTLRSLGKYVVTVTDDAGNVLTEEFTIEFYLNLQGWIFGLLFVAVIAAAVIYMVYTKRRFRVR